MKIRHCWTVLYAFCSLLAVQPLSAADWLQWRGPLGTGESNEKSAPLTWSNTENIKWKAPLDGRGNSSPIVVGDKVYTLKGHKPELEKLAGANATVTGSVKGDTIDVATVTAAKAPAGKGTIAKPACIVV